MPADPPDRNAAPSSANTSFAERGPRRSGARAHQLLRTFFSPHRLPQTRDQLMLAMVALNELFLGLEVYLAHGADGTIGPGEWLPIYYGLSSGILLVLAGLLATRHRTAASVIATATLVGSALIGFLGVYFHLARAVLPTAPAGERLTLNLLVWAPPVLGPLAYSLAGLLGISATWDESPPASGRLVIYKERAIHLPYSKTRAYIFTVGMGTLSALVSSVLDHARAGFEGAWLWYAAAIGVFGTVVPVAYAAIDRPSRIDSFTYIVAMLFLIATGVLGSFLHVRSDLVFEHIVVLERFLRGAPPLAPLLFSNLGMLGLIALLAPELLQTIKQPPAGPESGNAWKTGPES
ncbi:MAG: hypothetical protein F4Y42_11160 [Caldilineaceae bacterium SB0664_bin_27]|uniref:Uncharacterized protein n=1 Tax=Caldilineaceae bacterium SB0664_bin_27 TaxID=2605260 RepID=A0A6B0YUF7_9CHLR|nr:hypothetical protein [Caldilineaceae bacterium SB0664_bin_27]